MSPTIPDVMSATLVNTSVKDGVLMCYVSALQITPIHHRSHACCPSTVSLQFPDVYMGFFFIECESDCSVARVSGLHPG